MTRTYLWILSTRDEAITRNSECQREIHGLGSILMALSAARCMPAPANEGEVRPGQIRQSPRYGSKRRVPAGPADHPHSSGPVADLHSRGRTRSQWSSNITRERGSGFQPQENGWRRYSVLVEMLARILARAGSKPLRRCIVVGHREPHPSEQAHQVHWDDP